MKKSLFGLCRKSLASLASLAISPDSRLESGVPGRETCSSSLAMSLAFRETSRDFARHVRRVSRWYGHRKRETRETFSSKKFQKPTTSDPQLVRSARVQARIRPRIAAFTTCSEGTRRDHRKTWISRRTDGWRRLTAWTFPGASWCSGLDHLKHGPRSAAHAAVPTLPPA